MKKILCLISICLIGLGAKAQGFVESFDYTVGGNIGGNCVTDPCDNNNWNTIAGSVSNDTTIDIVAGSLDYIHHFSSAGNKILLPEIVGGSTRDISRATGFTSAGWTSCYFSFLINVIDDSRIKETFSDQANFINFSNGSIPNGGGPQARVCIRKEGGVFRLGIVNNGGNQVYTELPKDLNYGETHLVVVKYTKGNGGNSVAELWADPIGAGVNADGDPLEGVSNNSGTSNPGNLPQLQIRTTSNAPNAYIDEIRTGYTINDVVQPILLPVSLSNFTATAVKSSVELKWETSQEINTSFFEVQRSNDGSNFSTINKMNAAGNSSSNRKYTSVDMRPSTGNNYYRLAMVDVDGKVRYSNTLMVKFDKEANGMQVIGGTNGIRIALQATEQKAIEVALFNMSGQRLATKQFSLSQGYNALNMPVQLMRGTYIITLSGNTGRQVQKLVITE